MKKPFNIFVFAAVFVSVTVGLNSCKNNSTNPNTSTAYATTYLVSDSAGFGAQRIDPDLLNGWGIAVLGDGSFLLAANHDSAALHYTTQGTSAGASVGIPLPDRATGGSPSGAVVNTTGDFNGAKVIFATEDGDLAAWNSGAAATSVTTPVDSMELKGVAIANDGGANFLYTTDFKENKIVVYDKNFTPVPGKVLVDPGMPAGFSPFGIAAIGNQLYVTYAAHKPFPNNGDDLAGASSGYVDVFNPNGTLVKRFASQGTLNSPWGIAKAGDGFGKFKDDILISNFGDGAINAFDTSGAFMGQLSDSYGTAIHIDGLWGISFNSNAGDPNFLYFTAGPNEENHGAFGYVQTK